jgi:hypothetical protein
MGGIGYRIGSHTCDGEADARSNTDPERNKGKEAGDTNYGNTIPVLAVMRR